MKTPLRYDVKTAISPDMIELVTLEHGYDGVHEIARQVVMLRDQAVRDALIKLGWTPPADEPKS